MTFKNLELPMINTDKNLGPDMKEMLVFFFEL